MIDGQVPRGLTYVVYGEFLPSSAHNVLEAIMDHEKKTPQVETENQESAETPYEELTDDDLDDVAGGWDGVTPPRP